MVETIPQTERALGGKGPQGGDNGNAQFFAIVGNAVFCGL